MVEALRCDGLQSMTSDRKLLSGERLSRDDGVRTSGLDPDQFDSIATAFGFIAVDPVEPSDFSRSEVEAIATFGSLSTMFSRAEILSFFRVLGSSMGRIAEASGLVDEMARGLGPILQRQVFQAVHRSRQSMLPGFDRHSSSTPSGSSTWSVSPR